MDVRLCESLMVFSVILIHAGLADKIVLARDGDVITPRMNIQRKKYHRNEDQTWYLNATSGHWALVFHYISLESEAVCRYDYIEIKEQPRSSKDRKPPTRYCGEILPKPYVSDASRLFIRFVSDMIWEGEGFNITVVHGHEKELLKSKVHHMTQKYTATIALQAEDNTMEIDFDRGAMFYILIGSSTAALVIFVILLTYFGIAMRKESLTHETRVPKLHYISGSSACPVTIKNDGTFARLKTGTNVQSVQELCSSGKKRYSKDRKTSNMTTHDSTKEKYVASENRVQHNNLYVQNRK